MSSFTYSLLKIAETIKRTNPWYIVFMSLYTVYMAVFIYNSGVVIDGVRYFFLHDDPMISMRYAKNLANGFGLVWNPGGEKVEGITNLLWTIYMSLFHLLPVSTAKMSLFIQISGALFLLANLFFIREISFLLFPKHNYVSVGAVILTALYLPLINWTLMGIEVGVLALLSSVTVWIALKCIHEKKFSLLIYFLFGIGILVRIDMVLSSIGIWIYLLYVIPSQRKNNFVFGASILFLFLGSQTVFRLLYYGEILPNTYFLKMTGYPVFLRITKGIYCFVMFTWHLNWLLFFSHLVILYKAHVKTGLLFLFFWLQILYSTYVGGDFWFQWGGNSRFIVFVMPFFFILFSASLAKIINLPKEYFQQSNRPFLIEKQYINRCIFFLLVFVGLISFNCFTGPSALNRFFIPGKTPDIMFMKKMIRIALNIEKMTKPTARIAIHPAGIIPYFTNRFYIDILGKNDTTIAKSTARSQSIGIKRLIEFNPGHMKYDYDYSIGRLKPDVILGLWQDREKLAYYTKNKYVKKIFFGEFEACFLVGSNKIINFLQ